MATWVREYKKAPIVVDATPTLVQHGELIQATRQAIVAAPVAISRNSGPGFGAPDRTPPPAILVATDRNPQSSGHNTSGDGKGLFWWFIGVCLLVWMFSDKGNNNKISSMPVTAQTLNRTETPVVSNVPLSINEAGLYRKAAEQGDANAQIKLGVMYYQGNDIPQDYAEAVNWFRKAAEQGLASAQYYLGAMYANGQGVAQNYAEAVNWFRKAAEQGHAEAQHNIGVMYAHGKGVAQNYAEAVNWFRKAAEQGLASAQYYLGAMYDNGQGVIQDDAEAVKFYRKAAEQGLASAQYYLGAMYANGQGVIQDDAEAVNFYRKAAEQGHAEAQYCLGAMYVNGQGVPRNYVLSYMWTSLAAAQGHEDAKKKIHILETKMTTDQIAKAQRLVHRR